MGTSGVVVCPCPIASSVPTVTAAATSVGVFAQGRFCNALVANQLKPQLGEFAQRVHSGALPIPRPDVCTPLRAGHIESGGAVTGSSLLTCPIGHRFDPPNQRCRPFMNFNASSATTPSPAAGSTQDGSPDA